MQAPLETLETGQGTCRDFAVLMIDAVRSLGLPARFVSGYLYVPPRDPQPISRRRLHPRLGAGLSAGRRLDRVRSDQRDRRQPRPDPRRRRARSARRRCRSRARSPDFPPTSEGMTVTVQVEREIGAGRRSESVRDERCVKPQRAKRRSERHIMQIRAGYEITYDCPQPTPMLLVLSIHPSRLPDLATPHQIQLRPADPVQRLRGRLRQHLHAHHRARRAADASTPTS